MTNEDKAKQIARNIAYNLGNKVCDDIKTYGYEDVYNAALQAMELKDKQFQKVLDYAENCYGVFSFEQRENFINHIKEIFYGKE